MPRRMNWDKNVVVIGAGKYGFELALGLAMDGHKVTNLSSASYLFEPDFQGPHNMQNQEGIYKTHPNFSYALNVRSRTLPEERSHTRIPQGRRNPSRRTAS